MTYLCHVTSENACNYKFFLFNGDILGLYQLSIGFLLNGCMLTMIGQCSWPMALSYILIVEVSVKCGLQDASSTV